MAALVALSALAQGKPPPALIALDDESAADVMRGPLDVLLMFETSWCEATVKKDPEMGYAAQKADWPRLSGAWNSLGRELAPQSLRNANWPKTEPTFLPT